MGPQQTKIQEETTPAEFFATKEHIEKRLFARIQSFLGELLVELYARFDETSSVDQSTATKYWTEQAFVDYLAERNPIIGDVVREAGSLLYKVAIHQGSYPFPATGDALLTREKLVVFVGMCSHIQTGIFKTVDVRGAGTRGRRKPREVNRLFFQSIADGKSSQDPRTPRTDADDEDLIDVMCSVGPNQLKIGNWTRDDLRPAARFLPSSRSADLSGTISEEDLRLFIRLLVSATLRRLNIQIPGESTWSDFTHVVVESLVRSTSETSQRTGRINWDSFLELTGGSMPYIMTSFMDFIDDTFNVYSNESFSESWPIMKSQILEPQHLSLIKFLARPLGANFTSIISAGSPKEKASENFLKVMIAPHRLLFMKSEYLHPVLGLDTIIGAFVYLFVENEEPHEVSKLGEEIFDVTLFELRPSYRKLASGCAEIIEKGRTTGNIDEALMQFDDAKLVFSNNLQNVRFERGEEVLELRVNSFEVWTDEF